MQLGLIIKYLDDNVKKSIEDKFKELGVTRTQGFIIKYINNSESDINQHDIETHFNLKRSTVSEIISLMEKNGLIKRIKDGRKNKIVLTDLAKEIHDSLCTSLKEIEKRIIKGFTDEELNQFLNYIDRINKNLEEGYND